MDLIIHNEDYLVVVLKKEEARTLSASVQALKMKSGASLVLK